MKEIMKITDSFDLKEKLMKLTDYILELNQNRELILYNYNGFAFKEHCSMFWAFGHIENLRYKTIHNDREFLNYIGQNDISDNTIIIAYQYIEDPKNILKDYIIIKEDNLYNRFGKNKQVIVMEYHMKQFSDMKLIKNYIKEHESVLDEKGIFIL